MWSSWCSTWRGTGWSGGYRAPHKHCTGCNINRDTGHHAYINAGMLHEQDHMIPHKQCMCTGWRTHVYVPVGVHKGRGKFSSWTVPGVRVGVGNPVYTWWCFFLFIPLASSIFFRGLQEAPHFVKCVPVLVKY